MNQEQTISREDYIYNQLGQRIAALEIEKAQVQAENIILSQKINDLTKNDEKELTDHANNE
ncbi:hypothetical protein [Tetragenococcus halophilus]|uniref:hypothetical protein n=1 Tax=Tetragenococcus halophilus TaxID=51669 RepID=UPI00209A713B|nr:hypothetical protein [Tetragenococcus halophilus]MCO8292327.1 hypothetical protein [Tetragenococcus halophilus]